MPTQVFIRNTQGRIWGPLEPQSVQLLLEGGLLEPPLQVSLNGIDFAAPDLVPEFAQAVPKEIWSGAALQKPAFVPPVLTPQAMGAPPHLGFHTAIAEGTVSPTDPRPPAPETVAVPTPTQASEIPSQGNLAELSPVKLYGWAASTDANGRFLLMLPDRVLDLHFRKGSPERVESNHPSDALDLFLKKQGLATDATLAQAEKEKARFGGELLPTLFALGTLNPGTAFGQLAQRAASILSHAFLASSGRFTFELKELPATQAIPLGNRWSVLSDVVRKLPIAELAQRLSGIRQLPAVRVNGRIQVGDLKLNAVETRAFSRVDGTRSLEQLVKDFPTEAEAMQRVVFMLRELELISFAMAPPRPQSAAAAAAAAPARPAAAAGSTSQAGKPTPAPARPGSGSVAPPRPGSTSRPGGAAALNAAPAAPPAPVLSLEDQLKELRARAKGLPEQNHLQVLGVPETVDSASVKAAYFKAAKVLHPDTVPQDAPKEVGQLKAVIFAAVSEAYRVLGEDVSRANYLNDLKSGALDKVDLEGILKAEEKFQRACVVFKSRRYPEALVLFEECIAANPEEGEFYAWRGYARFITGNSKPQAQAEALRDLTEALKRNPRCAPAHYFSGMIAKSSGDLKSAGRHFQNTVDLDPQHVDAQRELRFLSKGR